VSLKSAPYYWLECDQCGVKSTDEGEFAAWSDSGTAFDNARDDEWTTDGERDHCPNCPSITKCEQCGSPAGELAGRERDDHCEKCWTALDAPTEQEQT